MKMLTTPQLLLISLINSVGPFTIQSFNEYVSANQISFTEDATFITEIFQKLNESNKRIRIPSKEDIIKAIGKRDLTIEESTNNGIKIISIADDAYPYLLKTLKDRPIVLHYKGNIECVNTPTVAVIGTREPSQYAIQNTPKLLNYINNSNLTIVSGLARGCDTMAHTSAINAGKPNIAVLAGGLHKIYPKENIALSDQILEHNGLLISELPFGEEPQRFTFVQRDRLQSGLSYGVFVIETGLVGGSLHTVEFAGKQNRIVACYFSQLESAFKDYIKYQGNIKLVEEKLAMQINDKETLDSFINKIKSNFDNRKELFSIKEVSSNKEPEQTTLFKL